MFFYKLAAEKIQKEKNKNQIAKPIPTQDTQSYTPTGYGLPVGIGAGIGALTGGLVPYFFGDTSNPSWENIAIGSLAGAGLGAATGYLAKPLVSGETSVEHYNNNIDTTKVDRFPNALTAGLLPVGIGGAGAIGSELAATYLNNRLHTRARDLIYNAVEKLPTTNVERLFKLMGVPAYQANALAVHKDKIRSLYDTVEHLAKMDNERVLRALSAYNSHLGNAAITDDILKGLARYKKLVKGLKYLVPAALGLGGVAIGGYNLYKALQ